MVIGITGGIGSGKSYVVSIMEHFYDGVRLEADTIAHQLEQSNGSCFPMIVKEFGTEILTAAGEIDRKKLGEIVFCEKQKLEKLNQIVHPAVKIVLQEEIKRIQGETKNRLILIEAALLFEAHYDTLCDEVWYVFADEKIRRKRLKEKRGYSDEKINAVMNSQLKEDDFLKRCDFVIKNNGTEEEIIKQIKQKALQRGQEIYE